MKTPTGDAKIARALAAFECLTASQIIRLLYRETSEAFVRKKLKALEAHGLVTFLGGRRVGLPRCYTLTSRGRQYTGMLGSPARTRFRPYQAREKAENFLFLAHTIAVTDVLIAAQLLSQRVPGLVLNRMYLERELKRKLYVAIALPIGNGTSERRTLCLEPDAAVDFVLQGKWQEFFHIEVYRSQLSEYRFKQKIAGYAAYAASSTHQELFATPALAIAVLCSSSHLAATLKRWTEEVLRASQQPELGERFFFTSSNPATVSPEALYLSPVWEQAFGATKTPLLVLE